MRNVRQHNPQRAYAVRGNAYSFHMRWEDIAAKLIAITGEEAIEALPHDEHALSHMVLFSLRGGDIEELNKWLPMARLRPHVVLQLLFSLVDAGFVKMSTSRTVQQLKAKLKAQLAARYPEREAHLPESKREGYIPPAVEAAIRKAMRPVPGLKETYVFHKHVTPAAAPESLEASINQLRPSSLFADRGGDDVVQKCKQDLLVLSKHYVLRASTSNTLVSQWNAEYLPLAFPFSLRRPVSGAAFLVHPSERRQKAHNGSLDFVRFEPWEFGRALPARVGGNVRGS